MAKVELTKLIESGAHFGHLTRRWNPKMKPYIFMEKNGIHIIDLKKTQELIEEAKRGLTNIVSQNKKVLFVGTKKQAKSVISTEAQNAGMYWVSERWLGGMLTNFSTIRKSVKRLQNIDKMESDGTFDKITKKEILQITREREKLRKVLDGIENMNKLPGAIFIVDIKKESIAVQEAHRLNIPLFAIVDTNCDPDEVDYVIPANDDAVKTVELIVKEMMKAVEEGSQKAKELRAEEAAEKERTKKEEEKEDSDGKAKVRRVRFDDDENRDRGSKKSSRMTTKRSKQTAESDEELEEKKAEVNLESEQSEKKKSSEETKKETPEEKPVVQNEEPAGEDPEKAKEERENKE